DLDLVDDATGRGVDLGHGARGRVADPDVGVVGGDAPRSVADRELVDGGGRRVVDLRDRVAVGVRDPQAGRRQHQVAGARPDRDGGLLARGRVDHDHLVVRVVRDPDGLVVAVDAGRFAADV